MTKPYRIQVFGKSGCDKCKTLNQRLDRLLAKAEWEQFEKAYCDVMTVEGLIPFCEAECINPQQIPALLVSRFSEEKGEYEPIPSPPSAAKDEVCGGATLFHYVGLQTDYTAGGGVITPKMITSVLTRAREMAPVDRVEEPSEKVPSEEAAA